MNKYSKNPSPFSIKILNLIKFKYREQRHEKAAICVAYISAICSSDERCNKIA